jgi:endonuclease/exonuclease/phosphatase family metal-dependent hydrolase
VKLARLASAIRYRHVLLLPAALVLGACRDRDDPFDLDAVTMMSFNIFYDRSCGCSEDDCQNRCMPDWSGRRHLVVETIADAAPDVVGLQEAYLWQVQELIAALPQFDYVGRAADAAQLGWSVSILYRKDRFDLADAGHFWFSDTPDTPGSAWAGTDPPRMVTWVRLTRKETGRSFYAYNTHLASVSTGGAPSREMSVRLLAQRIADRRYPAEHFLVTGDFNAEEFDFPIRYLRGEVACPQDPCPDPSALTPARVIDAWRNVHPSEPGGTRCRNWPDGTVAADTDGHRIDYTFAWNPVPASGVCDALPGACAPPRVVDAEAILPASACPSDHRATTATVILPLGGEEYRSQRSLPTSRGFHDPAGLGSARMLRSTGIHARMRPGGTEDALVSRQIPGLARQGGGQ